MHMRKTEEGAYCLESARDIPNRIKDIKNSPVRTMTCGDGDRPRIPAWNEHQHLSMENSLCTQRMGFAMIPRSRGIGHAPISAEDKRRYISSGDKILHEQPGRIVCEHRHDEPRITGNKIAPTDKSVFSTMMGCDNA